MGVTGIPVLAPTGADSIAQGAALGINQTFDVQPQRGAISRMTCGNFAPLGLKRRLAPEPQGCALGYRISPPWGLTPHRSPVSFRGFAERCRFSAAQPQPPRTAGPVSVSPTIEATDPMTEAAKRASAGSSGTPPPVFRWRWCGAGHGPPRANTTRTEGRGGRTWAMLPS
jgi:hypothetical protein